MLNPGNGKKHARLRIIRHTAPASAVSPVAHPSWCTDDVMLEDGELWHRTSQSERDGVVIDLVMPHGPLTTAGPPRWRLVIHDQLVPLPPTFSTWTLLDLMAAWQEAAAALESLPWAPEDSGDFDALTAPEGPGPTWPQGTEEEA